jgi:bis(5'-nucleosyl)-tetraphosphatase (symmetrical)
MANYAIGDIQGCYQELILLLDKINFNSSEDRLWLCGDLVNRGPDSLKCIDFLHSIKQNCFITLGNHDLHLIALAEDVIELSETDTLDDLLKSHNIDLYVNWLKQLPLIHTDTLVSKGIKKEYVMTHAGVPPHWSLEEAKQYSNEISENLNSPIQSKHFLKNMYGNEPSSEAKNLSKDERLRLNTNYFTRMRFCDELGKIELTNKGTPSNAPQGFKPWFKHELKIMEESTHLLFGHWAALKGVTGVHNITALDTGCVWGERLTAINLEDGRVFSCNRVN